MKDKNEVQLIGRLGKNPEVKMVKDGAMMICKFSVATGHYKRGVKEPETEWTNVTTFGQTAEQCNSYLKKGARVQVEGRLKTDKWEKDGKTNYYVHVIANEVRFFDTEKTAQKQESERKEIDADVIPF